MDRFYYIGHKVEMRILKECRTHGYVCVNVMFPLSTSNKNNNKMFKNIKSPANKSFLYKALFFFYVLIVSFPSKYSINSSPIFCCCCCCLNCVNVFYLFNRAFGGKYWIPWSKLHIFQYPQPSLLKGFKNISLVL